MDVIGNILLNCIIWFLTYGFFLLMHEIGHAMMYRITSNDSNWKIVLGEGKTLLQTKRIKINKFFYIGGHCYYGKSTDIVYIKILRSLAGMLANALCICIFVLLLMLIRDMGVINSNVLMFVEKIIYVALTVNAIIIILSSLPMNYPGGKKDNPSDCLRIIRDITKYKNEKIK